MISQGHRAGDLLDYAPAKIELYYRLAAQRVRQTGVAEDLRMLRLLRVAIVAALSEKGGRAFREIEATLEAELKEPGGSKKKKVNRALAQIAKALNG